MNMIRMNLYRMFKMKSFYILQALILLLNVVSVIGSMRTGSADATSAAAQVSSFFVTNAGLVALTIFISLFVNAERTSGYLKNLSNCSDSRTAIYLSKIPMMAVFVLIEFAFVTIVCTTFYPWKGAAVGGFFLQMALELLLYITFGMFILMIMELFRHLLAGIVVGFIFCMMNGLSLISMLFTNVLHLEKVVDYLGYFSINQVKEVALMEIGTIHNSCSSAIISVVVFCILYGMVGIVSFRKRDMY